MCVCVWVAFSQKFVYKKRNIYAIKAKLAMNAARVLLPLLLLLGQATKVAIKLLAFCKVFPFPPPCCAAQQAPKPLSNALQAAERNGEEQAGGKLAAS